MSEQASPVEKPRPLRREAEADRLSAHLRREKRFLEESEQTLLDSGLDPAQVRALFARRHAELAALQGLPEEFRGLKDRSRLPDVLLNLEGLGRALVQLRVRSGLSQRELARRTGVHESQVSRDEKIGYGNATIGRLQRVIKALDGRLVSTW